MKALLLKKRIAGIVLTAVMAATTILGMTPITADAAASAVTISKSAGWFEGGYAQWAPVSGAKGYVAYVKGASAGDSSYTKLDTELIRQYSGYWRADAVGLAAGNYTMKIAAVDSNGKVISSATTNITASAYDRSGFAFSSKSKFKTASGAYNDNGTLKSNATVLYVTPSTAKTVTMDVITDSKGGKTTCKGIQAILVAKQKGYDLRPLDIRVVGCINANDVDYFASSSEGIQIKGKAAYSEMNITIEGIGEDAACKGFGFLIRNAGNIEIRNIAMIDFMDDGISLDTNNCNIWVHNVDLYYGQTGSDADQKKGDGSIDVKAASTNVTISYCHFYDSGKCSLCGMSDTAEFLVTYHHNWFDHSDSRHARIRVASVHLYNNYFDGNSKYGVGTTKGSSAFVEANYFRNCKYPMLSSMQGSDKAAGGIFSGEAGGMIKAYNNQITGAKSVIYANSGSNKNASSFDAYLASSRSEAVPSSYKTVSGGTSYNNFDTSSAYDLGVSASKVDAPANVPSIVKKYAGRMNGGDFQWTFSSSDDEAYAVNTALKSAVENYKSSVVSIGGYSGQVTGDNSSSNTTTGNTSTGSTSTGSTTGNTSSGSTSTGSTGTTTTPTTNTTVTVATSKTLADGWYYIKNVNAQKYLQVANNTGANYANVEIGTGTGVEGQKWYLTNEANGVITLKNGTGYMLDVLAGSPDNNANIQIYTDNGASAQRFVIGKTASSGKYAIITLASSKTKCIDAAGAKTADGTNVCQYTTSGANNQLWIFEATNGPSTPVVKEENTNSGSTSTGSQNTPSSSTTTTTATHNFTTQGTKSDVFTIAGNLSTSKGTVNYNGMTLTQCLKLESATSITFKTASATKLTLVLNSDFAGNVNIDGANKAASKGIVTVDLAAGSHTIKKADTANIYYIALGTSAASTSTTTTKPESTSGSNTTGTTGTSTSGTTTPVVNENTSSSTPATTPTTSTPSIKVEFSDGGCWGAGYVGNITITNTGSTTIKNWTAVVKTPDKITSAWSATLVSSANGVTTLTNAGYNADIAPGASVSFGFAADCATYNKVATPTVTIK